jgi:ferrous iron transport protein A
MDLKTGDRRPLADLAPGLGGRLRVAVPERVPRRLGELGLVDGTRISVVRRGPLGDPVEIELRGYRLCVRRADLAGLDVLLEPGAGE